MNRLDVATLPGGRQVNHDWTVDGLLSKVDYGNGMSRVYNYDNAYAESLFSRYKAELLEGGAFSDVEEAQLETFHYIDGYYNRIRRHSSLGYVSPEEYERKYEEERARKAEENLDQKTKKGVKAKSYSCPKF